MSHTEEKEDVSSPQQDTPTTPQKKGVDPKTVAKFLIRTVSLKKRKKIIDTWLATEWNGEQFLSSVLFKQRFLNVCFDVKFQHLLANTVSQVIKQDTSNLSRFKPFLESLHNSECSKLVHVQSTLVQCLSRALLTYLEVKKNEGDEEIVFDAYLQLTRLISRLYIEHPKQYCNHQFDMKKFSNTSAFKATKRVHQKIAKASTTLKLLEKFSNNNQLNEFIIAANVNSSTPLNESSDQAKFVSIVSDAVIKLTQANISFVDDGRTTWSSIFSQIKNFNSAALNEEIIIAIGKAYKRGKDRISGLIAEVSVLFQTEKLIPDIIDMLKTSGDKVIKNRGIFALEHVFASDLSELAFDSVSQFLSQGGLDVETKVAVFSTFSSLAKKSSKHFDLLSSYLRVISEADEVKGQILDTMSKSFFSDEIPLTDQFVEYLYSCLNSRKAATNTQGDVDVFYKSILSAVGSHPQSVSKLNDSIVKKVVEYMGNFVVGSEKKPADRVLAIYACTSLLLLSEKVPLAEKELKRSNVYSKALASKTPFLVGSDMLSRFTSDRDYVTFAEMLKTLLFNDSHLKNLGLKANESHEVLTSVCRILANTVSYTAQQRLTQALRANRAKPIVDQIFHQGFCDSLLKEAQERFSTLLKESQQYQSVELEKEDDDVKDAAKQAYNAKTLAIAFLATAPQLADISKDNDVSTVFLYAHHPLLLYQLADREDKRDYGRLWASYVQDRKIDELSNELLRTRCSEIAAYLTKIATSADDFLREAAVNAFSTLAFTKQPDTYNDLIAPEEVSGEIVLGTLANIFKSSNENLKKLTDEDCAVFLTPENTPYHDIEVELANNPMYKSQPTTETPKYSLTLQEWEEVSKREEEIHIREKQRQQKEKVKKEVRSVQEIRKMLVTQKVLEKEASVRKSILVSHTNTLWALRACSLISLKQTQHANRPRHLAYHLVMFYITDLFALPFSDLALTARRIYTQMADYHLSTSHAFTHRQDTAGPSAFGLADMLSRATYRLSSGVRDTTRIAEVDNDMKFAEYVILKLKLSLQGHTVSAATFASILPFLRQILHRKNVLGAKNKRFPQSSLSTAMSVLSIHAGLDTLVPVTREMVARVCIEEVLNYIPHLSKQAHHALIAMAPFLSVSQDVTSTDVEPIINGLVSTDAENTRFASLKTVEEYLRLHAEELQNVLVPSSRFVHAVFYAQFDDIESHATLASGMWQKVRAMLLSDEDKAKQNQVLTDISQKIRAFCCSLLGSSSEYVKYTAAAALAGSIDLLSADLSAQQESFVSEVIATLIDMYTKQISKNEHISLGVSAALIECSEFFRHPEKHMNPVYNFIFESGLSDQVAPDEFVNAGLSIVYQQGEKNKEHLINLFENFLKDSKSKDDYIVGSVVVFLGTVAKHLQASDNRLTMVIDRLIQTLNVQSNTVQQSVATALAPLVKILNSRKIEANQAKIDEIVERLLSGLKKGKSYGDRRGMAWGLAGTTKGLGVSSLYKVLKKLHVVLIKDGKNDKKAKEGVLLAYECLARMFGRLFEPYLVEVIPNIVFEGFSDSSKDVRECANDAATQVMAHMTGHGVRMILPGILKSVAAENTTNWRQKKANIQLLGHMAYCAPRQLATDLPVVVRALTQNLTDAHSEVAESAKKSLERVGSGVANPEITVQVPVIIQALEDPEKFTDQVLEALIHTRFTHSIDATSLALLIPILFRGLKERSTVVKKKSAQILGSMSALTTDTRDLMPYIESIIPLLKASLMDSSPQVRTASAKALGSISRSIGEDQTGGLIPWLIETLNRADARITAVERAGAAQALSEVIAAQGVVRLKEAMADILGHISGRTEQSNKNVREGYLQMFIYLPSLMRSKFEQFLPVCLPVILNGLSDTAENVRETALASSKVIVELFASSPTSLELLFPALNEGMENEEWRTRHSSAQLMYEFLIRLSKNHSEKSKRVKASDEDEEEVEEQTESSTELLINLNALIEILGKKTVDHILAVLFLLQNDMHSAVRSAATQLWRAMVVNTPRVLKSIIHTSLISLLISHLNKSEEQSVIAGKAMGELVLKLGENVVAELIPLLTEQLKSDDASVRQGVCIGLRELMNSTSERHLQKHSKILLPAIKLAVCDADESVQEAASDAFDVLCRVMGPKAVSEIIHALMKDLVSSDENVQSIALSGLRQLIAVRPQQVLPKLIPALVKKPITLTQARALASISQSLSGDEIQEHISSILVVYTEQLCSLLESDEKTFVDAGKIDYKQEGMTSLDLLPATLLALHSVVGTITLDNIYVIQEMTQSLMDNNNPVMRRSMLIVLQLFFDNLATSEDKEIAEDEEFLDDGFVSLLQAALKAFNDPDSETVKAAWYACSAMMKIIQKDNLPNYINCVREVISSQTEDDQGNRIVDLLPGFNIVPQGLDPLVNIFLQGLRYGKTVEIREQAALGLGDFIALTSGEALAPFVRNITGPLILVVGDRFPWQVKAAILNTLSLILEKGGANLKPFLPPLQTAFIKSLQDPTEVVRKYAVQSLEKLVPMNPRIEGLITEILTTLKKNAFLKTGEKIVSQFDQQSAGVCVALLDALRGVLSETVLKTLKATAIQTLLQTLLALADIRENTVVPQSASIITDAHTKHQSILEKIRKSACNCIAVCMIPLPATEFATIFEKDVLSEDGQPNVIQSRLCLIDSIFQTPGALDKLTTDEINSATTMVLDYLSQNINGARAAAGVLLSALFSKKGVWDASLKKSVATQIIEEFSNSMEANTGAADVGMRYEIVKAMKSVAKKFKKEGIYNTAPLFSWIPSLMQFGIKDRYEPVKLTTERVLLYILQQEDILKKYLSSEYVKDAKEAKIIGDYCTRVLKRLSEEDSEEEN